MTLCKRISSNGVHRVNTEQDMRGRGLRGSDVRVPQQNHFYQEPSVGYILFTIMITHRLPDFICTVHVCTYNFFHMCSMPCWCFHESHLSNLYMICMCSLTYRLLILYNILSKIEAIISYSSRYTFVKYPIIEGESPIQKFSFQNSTLTNMVY